jgi:hypothetical protein
VSLSLADVRRIAADVAKQQNPSLEVMAAIPGEGEPSYAEVILVARGSRAGRSPVMIGLNRNASEGECRGALKAGLEKHST